VPNDSTIAVVDDDASLREALKGLLRSAGFHAEVFASAEEFLRSGRLRGTACLILDVRMPGMSGVELQERLMGTDPAVPIVFISGHGDEEVRALALERGAVEFLQKPFSDEALLNAIAKASGMSSPDP
jgi:FixJ family two-component response regulator